MKSFSIDISDFSGLFPFLFTADKHGKILKLGPSLEKIAPEGWQENPHFDSLFRFQKPAHKSFVDLILNPQRELLILELISNEASLMGQVIKIQNEDIYVFVVNLIVQEAKQLSKLKLDFNDFAIQDPVFDFLMLVQTQRRSILEAELLNQKLEKAHKIAVHASETKSQFLANMSHELRTPMTGLIGMASLLAETKLSEEQSDYLKTLTHSAETMLALVNDILDLSKIEAGHLNLSQETVDLRELLSEAMLILKPLAEKKSIDLNLYIEPNIPQKIISDSIRLRQILLNLIGNAIKFTDEGFVRVRLQMVEESQSLKTIEFSVQDSGIGIEKDLMSQLFSPFVQGDSSMTKRNSGTGLGLSICKRIAEAMGGTMAAYTQLGIGSEFIFRGQFKVGSERKLRSSVSH